MSNNTDLEQYGLKPIPITLNVLVSVICTPTNWIWCTEFRWHPSSQSSSVISIQLSRFVSWAEIPAKKLFSVQNSSLTEPLKYYILNLYINSLKHIQIINMKIHSYFCSIVSYSYFRLIFSLDFFIFLICLDYICTHFRCQADRVPYVIHYRDTISTQPT